jgi:MYXO-CTERM domain-containing protein
MSDRKSLLHLRSLPPAVIALAAAGLTGPALAQNAANGQTLYKQAVPIPNSAPLSCENCHGAANIFKNSRFPNTTEAGILTLLNGAIAQNKGLMGAYSGWTPAMRADVAAYVAGATAAPPPPPLVQPPGTPAPAPAPTPAPAPAPSGPTAAPTASNPAMFASTEVGKESATAAVKITNTTASAVSFATPALIAKAGTQSEFVATTAPSGSTNCVPGLRLDTGASCSFGVRFAPRASGTRSETWTVAFANGVAPQEVTLTGTATAPAAAATSAGTNAAQATSSSSGGGGALGWLGLTALGALALLRRRPQ